MTLTAMASTLAGGEFDLAAVPFDALDTHVDRITESQRAAAAPAGERRAERRRFEVVAGQPARRQESLEDLVETHEETGADHADDLTFEGRFPALLVEARVEQPCEADVIGLVLDVRRLALAHGDVLGKLCEVVGHRGVGGADLAQQRAVTDEVGVPPDRRGEVTVRATGEAGVTEVP